MPTFRSFVELQRGLEREISIALDRVAEKVWQELYDFINEEIYISRTLKISVSGGYTQTGEFLDSLRRNSTVRLGNTFQAVIDFDTSKMKAEKRNDEFFNAHMSRDGATDWKGKSVSEWLPQWLDTGNGDSPFYQHSGIRFMDFIEEFLRRNFNKLMKIELQRVGLKIK